MGSKLKNYNMVMSALCSYIKHLTKLDKEQLSKDENYDEHYDVVGSYFIFCVNFFKDYSHWMQYLISIVWKFYKINNQ